MTTQTFLPLIALLSLGGPTANQAMAAPQPRPDTAPTNEAKTPATQQPRATNAPPDQAPPPSEAPPKTGPLPGATDVAAPVHKPTVRYGVGLNYQFLIVPQFFLHAFTEAAKSSGHNLYRHTFGAHFVRRKKNLDIIVRLMFGFMMGSSDDGNWLGRGHEWDELDYTEFHNLNFLWADATFIYHWEVAKGLFLGLGGGIGLGWVMGSVYTTSSSLNGTGAPCNGSNYSNCSQCHPSGAVCDKNGCRRSSLENNPDRDKSNKIPPVLPALNGVFSVRYDFWRHMSARLSTGIFLPGLWSLETSVEWVF